MTHDKLLFVLICYALLTFSLACVGAFLCLAVRALREEYERKKIERWLSRKNTRRIGSRISDLGQGAKPQTPDAKA